MIRVWMPYISAGSGADVSTRYLASGLRNCGCDVIDQAYPHCFEFFPWLLTHAAAPPNTNIILTNTWNGFAFSRPGAKMVTVDRLFVLDPALARYKSRPQRAYHDLFVRRHVLASARQADAVVAVSDYTAEVFARELSLPKPQVILNAVDTEFFTPSPSGKRPRQGRSIRLLYVGNLSRRKGSDLLAPIMEELGSDYELYYTAGLRASVLNGRKSNMYPLGRLDQSHIRDQYRQADLLLFPSRGEGLPRAVMEAMACGTPVIAADVSSLPEAVTPATGCLCAVDDIKGFSNAVRRVTSNSGELAQMGHAARARAEQIFDLKRMVGEYLRLFERLLAE